MTNEKYTEEFKKALNNYIELGFNQDECNGFMHGFHKGAEVHQLIIADVSNHVCPNGKTGSIIETEYGKQCNNCKEFM
jgi:hypothetical protein